MSPKVLSFNDAREQLCAFRMIVDIAGVGSGQVEKYVLALYWLWQDGSQDRSGIQLAQFRVRRLGVPVFPALP